MTDATTRPQTEPPLGRLALRNPGFERRALPFVDCGAVGAEDLALLDVVAARLGERRPDVLLALALAMRAPAEGSAGVDLAAYARQWSARLGDMVAERAELESLNSVEADASTAPIDAPEASQLPALPGDISAWMAAVESSPLVGSPDQTSTPFVVQHTGTDAGTGTGSLLMSRRQWATQAAIAARLRVMAAGAPGMVVDDAAVAAYLERLRASFNPGDLDAAAFAEQQDCRAVRAAASRRLTVVTGGPGTGKTFSVKRILGLLLEQPRTEEEGPLRVVLAAPTGKAAARMKEAMAEELDRLPVDEAVRATLASLHSRTLHKLLGMRPDGQVRHHAEHPLEADVILVDEASMIDLRLMRCLLDAVAPSARLILLGDRDQLASVDAGTVLSDIVSTPLDAPEEVADAQALAQSVVAFHENHRFRDAPRIAEAARHIQARTPEALAIAATLLDPAVPDALPILDDVADRVTHLGVPETGGRPSRSQLDALAAPYLRVDDATHGEPPGYGGLLAAALRSREDGGQDLTSPALHLQLLTALDHYRVLAAHRRGALGVSGLARELAQRVRAHLHDAWYEGGRGTRLPADGGWWLGCPVLVRENAYDVNLMNGDVGLVLPVSGGRLAAVFVQREGDETSVRSVPLPRLPAAESALVMTIHKSQGSQFDRVAMVLVDRDSPIQTRELIYTALTRARRRVDWLGTPAVLRDGLGRGVGRSSGLAALLWGAE